MMQNKQMNYVRCVYCDKIFTFDELESHLCVKGEIRDYYVETDSPESIFIKIGNKYEEIPWKSIKGIHQTPKLNTLKKLGINPHNLPVLDTYFC